MQVQYDETNTGKPWLIVNARGIATDEYETEEEANDAIVEAKRANQFERDAY